MLFRSAWAAAACRWSAPGGWARFLLTASGSAGPRWCGANEGALLLRHVWSWRGARRARGKHSADGHETRWAETGACCPREFCIVDNTALRLVQFAGGLLTWPVGCQLRFQRLSSVLQPIALFWAAGCAVPCDQASSAGLSQTPRPARGPGLRCLVLLRGVMGLPAGRLGED